MFRRSGTPPATCRRRKLAQPDVQISGAGASATADAPGVLHLGCGLKKLPGAVNVDPPGSRRVSKIVF
jgi:hypothetical protein